ncbi:MAG: hypothetical protein K9N49_02400 [Candidatus Marinimicrobia bacterium]|nr:hypothetical protein [Candidatus Neomarinimicrobiota bacterium]
MKKSGMGLLVVALVLTGAGWLRAQEAEPVAAPVPVVAGDEAAPAGVGASAETAELPVVRQSPGMQALVAAQRELSAFIARQVATDPALQAIDKRINELSAELGKLSAERQRLLEQDETYQDLFARQTEALKAFQRGE